MAQFPWTVLLLDDERDHLELMERSLRTEQDLKLLLTQSSSDALGMTREQQIHVFVFDHRMPAITGVDLLGECRQMRPDAKGIVVTAYPYLPEIVSAQRLHGLRVITKPYDPEVLVKAVREAVKQFGRPAAPGQTTVLAVEDEPDNLEMIVRVLRAEPAWQVVSTASAAEALKIASTRPVQVIISDYRMPEMSGVELIQRCRAWHPLLMAVVVTGYGDLSEIVAGKERKDFLVVAKPFTPEQLRDAVKLAVSFHRIRAQLALITREPAGPG